MGSAFLNKHIAAFVYKKTETKTKTKKTKTNTRGAIRSFLEKNIAAFMDKKTETKTKKEGAIRSLTRQGNHLVRQTCIAAFGCAPCTVDHRGVWICGTSLCDAVDLLVLASTQFLAVAPVGN